MFCARADSLRSLQGAVVADVKEEKSFKSYIRSLAAKYEPARFLLLVF